MDEFIMSMNGLAFAAAAGVVFGIALAFYITADQIKDSNDMGNTKGGRLDYLTTFDIFDLKNEVPGSMNIEEIPDRDKTPAPPVHSSKFP